MLSEGSQVRQANLQLIVSGVVDVIGNVTDGIDDVVVPRGCRQIAWLAWSHRYDDPNLARHHNRAVWGTAPLQPANSGHPAFLQLATPGIGKFRRTNAGSRVDFYSSGTQAGCRVQSLFEWLLQTTQPDPDL